MSYALSERNDNPLGYKTFDKAIQKNSSAHPLFHSDKGYHSPKSCHRTIVNAAGNTRHTLRHSGLHEFVVEYSAGRILKRERYYGRQFTSKKELIKMIKRYIEYYNTKRVQRNLGVLTPMEKHKLCIAA